MNFVSAQLAADNQEPLGQGAAVRDLQARQKGVPAGPSCLGRRGEFAKSIALPVIAVPAVGPAVGPVGSLPTLATPTNRSTSRMILGKNQGRNGFERQRLIDGRVAVTPSIPAAAGMGVQLGRVDAVEADLVGGQIEIRTRFGGIAADMPGRPLRPSIPPASSRKAKAGERADNYRPPSAAACASSRGRRPGR